MERPIKPCNHRQICPNTRYFDKINETEPGVGGEIQLTDALQKLDSIYGVTFKGKTYDIANRLEWLKTSIEFALDDNEFRDDLVKYMKNYI